MGKNKYTEKLQSKWKGGRIMDFKKIIEQIMEGMSGDNEKDIVYLKEQMDKYAQHENSLEILRAIGRKIYDLLPEESKTEFVRLLGNTDDVINMVIDEAFFQLTQNHDPIRAEKLYKSIIDSIEGLFKDDEEAEYHSFDNIYEEVIYKYIDKPQKTLRRSTFDNAMIYYFYGYCLIDNEKLDEAEQALLEACRWDPVKPQIIFELAEIYKMKKDFKPFLKYTATALKYAYSPADIARAYRNYGFYYTDIEEYEKGAAFFYLSNIFQDDKTANSELFYIAQTIGKLPDRPEPDEMKKLCEQEGVQFWFNKDVVSLIYQVAQALEEDGVKNGAVFGYSIVYKLTNDDEIKKRIDLLTADEPPMQ